MSFNFLPPVDESHRPFVPERECTLFVRWYIAILLFIAANALAAALWPAGSITTSSRTVAAGSSCTACPASTPGSSR